jgi:hypothetical protein
MTKQNTIRALLSAAIAIFVGTLVALDFFATANVRDSLATFSALLDEANTPKPNRERLALLCSASYLSRHKLTPSPEGGVEGLPRTINKNFRAWQKGDAVLVCPAARDSNGPVYQFVREADIWKFDGPVAILTTRGELLPFTELSPENQTASSPTPNP